jgi:hypothetical protein
MEINKSIINHEVMRTKEEEIMKIQYASDIHLELSDNSRFIKNMPFEVVGDVLVFAGDTGYLRDRTLPNLKFWKWASAISILICYISVIDKPFCDTE